MKACKSDARAGTDNEVTTGSGNITPVSIPQMDASDVAEVTSGFIP
jgi:hypothetical protein